MNGPGRSSAVMDVKAEELLYTRIQEIRENIKEIFNKIDSLSASIHSFISQNEGRFSTLEEQVKNLQSEIKDLKENLGKKQQRLLVVIGLLIAGLAPVTGALVAYCLK